MKRNDDAVPSHVGGAAGRTRTPERIVVGAEFTGGTPGEVHLNGTTDAPAVKLTAAGTSDVTITPGGAPGKIALAGPVTLSGALTLTGAVTISGDLTVDTNTLKVDATNNRVGVGTATPSVPLDVVGAAKVSSDLTVDTDTLKVDATNNRVGIGEATPAARLHIKSSDAGAAPDDVRIENASTGAAGIQFKNSNATANLWQVFLSSDATPKFKIGRDGLADYITISAGITSIVQEGWTAGTLGVGMSNYGAGFPNFQCKKLSTGLVIVTGLVKSTAAGIATNHVVGTLPAGYRPTSWLIRNGFASTAAAVRYDINADGTIQYKGATAAVQVDCMLSFFLLTDE